MERLLKGTLTHTLSLAHTHTHTHTRTHTLTHSHSHTHTLTLTHTHKQVVHMEALLARRETLNTKPLHSKHSALIPNP